MLFMLLDKRVLKYLQINLYLFLNISTNGHLFRQCVPICDGNEQEATLESSGMLQIYENVL
jgi:hypothetical protein